MGKLLPVKSLSSLEAPTGAGRLRLSHLRLLFSRLSNPNSQHFMGTAEGSSSNALVSRNSNSIPISSWDLGFFLRVLGFLGQNITRLHLHSPKITQPSADVKSLPCRELWQARGCLISGGSLFCFLQQPLLDFLSTFTPSPAMTARCPTLQILCMWGAQIPSCIFKSSACSSQTHWRLFPKQHPAPFCFQALAKPLKLFLHIK